MCGRACCALDPDTLCCACEYKDANGKQCKPTWAKTELEYTPSYNIAPQGILPCMVSGFHFEEKSEEERVLCAMIWGIIPPWHQGDYKQRSDKLTTHNSRLENMKSSKLYSQSLEKQQRCVVICEGFYEWKTADNRSRKQPYYVYAAQSKGVKADDPTTWMNEFSKMDGGRSGFRVLKLAGIFGEFTTDEGKIIHSCTIITRPSDKVLSWLHHRMPVCLNNEEDCKAWLNRDVPTDVAIKRLNEILQEKTLNWHPVSTIVNNAQHKTAECIKEIKPKEKNSQMSFMASWLQKGSAASIKRKSMDNKDTITSNREDEKASKILKEN